MKSLVALTIAVLGTSIAVAQTAPPVASPAVADANAQLSAADFVRKAAVGGLYEVQSSQLATTASQSNEVKQFAQQMISDHTAANQELKQLAASKNLQVPATLDEKHQKMMTKLQGSTGEEFDTKYGQQQAKAHSEAVTLFQNAANQLQDPELKNFAQKTLPILQQHAQMATTLPGADKAKPAGTNADH